MATTSTGHGNEVALAAVGPHADREQAMGAGTILQNGRTRTVAKQNAGIAVLPVDDGR